MKIITAPQSMDIIYSMGFDAWSEGQSLQDYLISCRKSRKYQSGSWYTLCVNDTPVSSLIVYTNQFGLSEHCYGIGSVVTAPTYRRRGYAAYLVSKITQRLLSQHKANAIYLHSDIAADYYHKLGFERVGNSCWMIFRAAGFSGKPCIPSYF
ncbi:GNAT family N-acetyltransferase [Gilvimarinus sp. DA14]|uniref:GNAT family N-acetyltransferase n=1 Tax=Gilvimarinus sp. DA14 TaxID=2956798 RepID=UPI0035317428